jgi:predicted kinase
MRLKRVWILSGCPGSGKSTWVRQRIEQYGGIHCSRDEIRFSLLKEGEDYFAHEDEVFALWLEKVINAINDPEVEDIYVDATHLTEKSRAKVLDELPKGNCFVTTVFFDVPLETCIKRNDNRTGRAFVPHSVIRRMHAIYDQNTKLGDATLHLDENGEWRGIE